jgi:hypothetical protein
MISVKTGNVEMCKLLIDSGALSSINSFNNVNIVNAICDMCISENYINFYTFEIYIYIIVVFNLYINSLCYYRKV